MRRWIAAIPLIPLGLYGSAACAQQASDEEVVVTATRGPATRTTPESTATLAQSDIHDTPAKSLDDVLRAIPSVTLPSAPSYLVNPVLSTVSMRGLGGSRALVLLDGVPLNDPFFGNVQWSLVPNEGVDRIEVIRGGNSALWGNYALGGVISVLTHAPDTTGLVASATGGGYGTWRADAQGDVRLDEHLGIGLGASANHTDGYLAPRPVDRTALTVPNRFDAYRLRANAAVELSPSLKGNLWASYHHIAQMLRSPLNRNEQETWYASGQLSKTFGDLALTASAFRVNSTFLIDNVDARTGVPAGTAEYVQNHHETPASNTGASLLLSRTGNGWLRLATVGMDYQLLDGTDTGSIYNQTGTRMRVDIGRGKQRFVALFGQVDVSPVPALQVLASARYQYFENFDGFDGAPGKPGAVPASHVASFNPRVSARYAVTPWLAFRVGANRAFRAPTLNNLYRSFSTRLAITLSNASLSPERLSNVEAGFDFKLPGFKAQVTYYDSSIDNLLTTKRLTAAQLPAGFVVGMQTINAGRARARGVEAEASARMGPLALNLGYTLADTTMRANTIEPGSIGLQIGGVPRQSASARLAYSIGDRTRIAARWRWHERYFNDNLHLFPIDSQSLFDINASVRVDRRFEVYAQVENLFDETRVVDNSGNSVPQLGTPRTALAGFRIRL